MNLKSLNPLVFLVVLVPWCKAGLAGTWVLFTIDIVVLYYLLKLLYSEYRLKYILKYFVPVILIVFLFLCSYLNPSYKALNEQDWTELSVEEALSREKNFEKVIFSSSFFKDNYILSRSNQQLSLTTFFDFKNRYYDKFEVSSSPIDKLINSYEKKITVNSKTYLPAISFRDNEILLDFFHKLIQLSAGIIIFLTIKKRKHIRNLIFLMGINSGLLAIVGLWQKLNYMPSENLLEILGIWDAPEPRYFFSTFTYKNHWACFVLLSLTASFAYLLHQYKRTRTIDYRKPKLVMLMISIILGVLSIPFSGSKSGSILLIIFFLIVMLFPRIFLQIKSYKKYLYFVCLFFIIIISSISFTKVYHNETWKEMVSNIDSQVHNLKDGKLPFRILLWDDLVSQISEKPLFGYGFGSYKIVNPIFQSLETRNERSFGIQYAHVEYTPLVRYGHNDWLEKVSEFGLFGFLLIVPYLFYIFKFLFLTRSDTTRVLLLGSVLFLLYSIVDFPSQTPACLLYFSIITGCALKYSVLATKDFEQ